MSQYEHRDPTRFVCNEYVNQTAVHPIALGMIFIAVVMLFTVRARYWFLVLACLSCMTGPAQRVVIAGVDREIEEAAPLQHQTATPRDHGRARGVIRAYRSRAEVEPFLDLIRPVHEGTHQNQIASTVTNSPFRREAVLASSDLNGHLCLTLEIDGDIAAFQIGRFLGTKFSLEELGFDRRFEKLAPGMSLLYASMDELAKDKIEYMHFGEGSAQYKTVLSDQSELCYSYIGYSNHLRCYLDRRIARGTKMFDKSIWKAIPADRIKRMVRRFLSSSRSATAC